MGVPKIIGTFLGVPVIRSIVFWGLYWGPPILGNYHVRIMLGIRVFNLGNRVLGVGVQGLGIEYRRIISELESMYMVYTQGRSDAKDAKREVKGR